MTNAAPTKTVIVVGEEAGDLGLHDRKGVRHATEPDGGQPGMYDDQRGVDHPRHSTAPTPIAG
jgi:hypothetical protein